MYDTQPGYDAIRIGGVEVARFTPQGLSAIFNSSPTTKYVDKSGDDSAGNGNIESPFLTIAKAIASVNDAGDCSVVKPYLICVGPGTYTETQLNIPSYCCVRGSSLITTIIQPASTSQHLFVLPTMCEISFMTLQNVGVGYAAIYSSNFALSTDFSQCHKLSIFNCDTAVKCIASSGPCTVYMEYVDVDEVYTQAIYCQGSNGFLAYINTENFYTYPSVVTTPQCLATGTATIDIFTGVISGIGTDIGVEVSDGALLNANGVVFSGSDIAILVSNVGAGSTILFDGVAQGETFAISVQHPAASGAVAGAVDYQKISVVDGANVNINVAGISGDAGQYVLKKILQGINTEQVIDLSKVIRNSADVGVESGGDITVVSGRQINVASGSGYLLDPTGGYIKYISWTGANLTIPADTEQWIFVTTSSTVSMSASQPDSEQVVNIGRVKANSTGLDLAITSSLSVLQYGNNAENLLRSGFGAFFGSGGIVSENASPLHLDISAGQYYFGTRGISISSDSVISFTSHYRGNPSGDLTVLGVTVVDVGQYDDGSGSLAAITALSYAKHAVYISRVGSAQKVHLVYSQAQYASQLLAQSATLPTPPSWVKNSVALLASIIVTPGATSLTQIIDERSRPGFIPSGLSGVTRHGDLTGLSNDDHTQYLLTSGTRAMTGNLNMGSRNVVSVGTVDGVVVSSHESRHLPNGSDPLDTAAASTISTSTTNTTGIANSFARSDHTHAFTPLVTADLPSVNYCQVSNSANLTPAASSTTALPWNIDIVANAAQHSTSVNNSRFIANNSGVYSLSGILAAFSGSGIPVSIAIRIDGSVVSAYQYVFQGVTNSAKYPIYWNVLVPMTSGHYAEVYITFGSGAGPTVYMSGYQAIAQWQFLGRS